MIGMQNLEGIPQFQSKRRLQSVVGETQFPLRMLPICTLLDIGTFVGIQGTPNPISHQNLFLGQVVFLWIYIGAQIVGLPFLHDGVHWTNPTKDLL